VRTGLIAVGAAMALVGAGVVVAITLPFSPADSSQTDRTWEAPVPAKAEVFHDVEAASVGAASISLSWHSTKAVAVYWYEAGPCAAPSVGWCVDGGPLQTWTPTTSGNWTSSGPAASEYCIMVDDPTNSALNFSAEFVESYPDPGHPIPTLPLALGVSGGALLIGLGGVAIYLGLFLPTGVYSSAPGGSEGDDEDLEPYDDRAGPKPP